VASSSRSFTLPVTLLDVPIDCVLEEIGGLSEDVPMHRELHFILSKKHNSHIVTKADSRS
jgi:hypothetical protein